MSGCLGAALEREPRVRADHAGDFAARDDQSLPARAAALWADLARRPRHVLVRARSPRDLHHAGERRYLRGAAPASLGSLAPASAPRRRVPGPGRRPGCGHPKARHHHRAPCAAGFLRQHAHRLDRAARSAIAREHRAMICGANELWVCDTWPLGPFTSALDAGDPDRGPRELFRLAVIGTTLYFSTKSFGSCSTCAL